jgi:hypothetical protein
LVPLATGEKSQGCLQIGPWLCINQNMSQFSSVESVVEALYQSVTFAAGVGPDYALLRALFHAQGRILPPAEDTGGIVCGMTVNEFAVHLETRLADVIAGGGSEIELSRNTLIFKRIAHVFSSYKFVLAGSNETVAQGVNTIQLLNDGNSWSIISLTWDRAPLGEPLTIQTG